MQAQPDRSDHRDSSSPGTPRVIPRAALLCGQKPGGGNVPAPRASRHSARRATPAAPAATTAAAVTNTAATTAAVAAVLLFLSSALAAAAAAPDAEALLAGADARIREHRMGEVVIKLALPAGQSLAAGTVVRIEQQRHAFLFGCNIYSFGRCRTPEDNAAYERLFADLFNFATLPFYWWSYERAQGQPRYEDTERILAWCKAHGITPKGHPLAWNYMDPRWLPDDPAAVIDLQFKRISACVSRFKGGIAVWDVVNEATDYGRQTVRTQAPKLTAAIDGMGVPPFVRECFRLARAADPGAALTINDYRLDENYAKQVIEPLVDDEGRPLYDIIGLQSHQHSGAIPITNVWAVCERYARFGKPLHWTETTFVSGEQGWELRKRRPDFQWVSTPEGEQRQAADTVRFYTILFSHPAVEGITWWDFSDQGAWMGAPAGLLTADMTPKPAYRALHDLVKNKWWTRLEQPLGADGAGGALRVRGFFGEYRVTLMTETGPLTGVFTLRRGAPGPIEVPLESRS